MNGRSKRACIAAGLLLALLTVAAIAGNTYFIDIDPNVTVTTPHCYSFVISVVQESGDSAQLTLNVFDVDESDGELDTVSLNGTPLGYLSGGNGVWSTTTFDIASCIIYGGDNTVEICIDPDWIEGENKWVAEIDWGQILVDGGSADAADITSISASGTWNAILVQTGVASSTSDQLRLEINLLDSGGNNEDIATQIFSLADGSSTILDRILSLPSEPTATETFTIEANLFNHTTGVQQTIETTTWTYSADEPPTDITLDSDHVDENLPALSLVGTLTAVDADSVSHQFTLIGGDIGSFLISADELQTAAIFDREAQDNYSIHIEAEDDQDNVYSEWFTITVNNVNEAPTARADAASVTEGDGVFVDVLANDMDPENDALDVVSVTDPSRGTAMIQLDETIEYVPNQGACGTDSFSYSLEDGQGESATTTVTITIQNTAPMAGDDFVETQEDESLLIDVLANDSDAGGGALAVASVGTPSYGTATIIEDKIHYTPQPRFEGSDRFSYVTQDSCGALDTGWIDVNVLHTNHPPTASLAGSVRGVVGVPLALDASFCHDPDLGDTLQYRWDLDGSGVPNTDWLSDPRYVVVYSEPFFGQVLLEVRDLYRGTPTGETSQATALVRIASLQSIEVFVFEDLDGNGVMDSGEPGLPGIGVTIAGETMTTEADGGISAELDAGNWDVAMTTVSISQLEARGFAILETEASVSLGISAIETVTLGVSKTLTNLKGIVYFDVDENEQYNEEEDRLLQGLRIVMDDDRETLTDDTGSFFFLSVPFGEHVLWVGENVEQDDPALEEKILSLFIPLTLSWGEPNQLEVRWPWTPTGPEQGFLQVEVEQSRGD